MMSSQNSKKPKENKFQSIQIVNLDRPRKINTLEQEYIDKTLIELSKLSQIHQTRSSTLTNKMKQNKLKHIDGRKKPLKLPILPEKIKDTKDISNLNDVNKSFGENDTTEDDNEDLSQTKALRKLNNQYEMTETDKQLMKEKMVETKRKKDELKEMNESPSEKKKKFVKTKELGIVKLKQQSKSNESHQQSIMIWLLLHHDFEFLIQKLDKSAKKTTQLHPIIQIIDNRSNEVIDFLQIVEEECLVIKKKEEQEEDPQAERHYGRNRVTLANNKLMELVTKCGYILNVKGTRSSTKTIKMTKIKSIEGNGIEINSEMMESIGSKVSLFIQNNLKAKYEQVKIQQLSEPIIELTNGIKPIRTEFVVQTMFGKEELEQINIDINQFRVSSQYQQSINTKVNSMKQMRDMSNVSINTNPSFYTNTSKSSETENVMKMKHTANSINNTNNNFNNFNNNNNNDFDQQFDVNEFHSEYNQLEQLQNHQNRKELMQYQLQQINEDKMNSINKLYPMNHLNQSQHQNEMNEKDNEEELFDDQFEEMDILEMDEINYQTNNNNNFIVNINHQQQPNFNNSGSFLTSFDVNPSFYNIYEVNKMRQKK